MKKLLLALAISTLLVCLFAVGVSAASSKSNEFGDVTTDTRFDATNMSTDATSRVVLMHTVNEEVLNEETGEMETVAVPYYTTYPSHYIVKNNSSLSLDFSKINEFFGMNYSKTDVIRFEVPTNVTTISKGTFNQCSSNIAYVYVKASSITLGQDSFHNAPQLVEISLPETVSLAGYVFNGCSKLTTVNVAGNGLATLGSGNLFSGCSSLTHIDLAGGYTSIPGNTFSGCSKLAIEFDLSTVTSISGSAFHSCYLMTFVNGENDTIKSVGQNAFFGCPGITRISFAPELSSVSSYAFNSCSNLAYVEFNNNGSIDPTTEKPYTFSIGNNAFSGCSKIANVINLKGCTDIGGTAFSSCSAVPNYINTDSVKTLGEKSFQGSKVEEFYFPAIISIGGKEVFNSNGNGGATRKVILGPNLTSINYQAFAYSPALKEVVFEGTYPANTSLSLTNDAVKIIFVNAVTELSINNSNNKNFSIYLIKSSIDDVTFVGETYTLKNAKVYSCVDKKAVQINSAGDTQTEIDFVHLYDKTVSTDPDCVNPAKDSKLCYCGVAIEVVEGAAALGHDYGVEDLEIVGWNYNGDYYSDAKFVHICTVCSVEYDGEVNVGSALFTNLGYSSFTYEENGVTKGSLVTRTQINTKAMQAYKAILTEDDMVLYGVYVGIYNNSTKPVNGDATANDGIVICKLEGTDYTKLELKVNGIGQDAFDTDLLCGAYMILNGNVAYLTNGNANESAQIIKFNDFKE